MTSSIWPAQPLPDEDPLYWKLGPLRLWAKRSFDELWLTFDHQDDPAATEEERVEVPETASWQRWTLKSSAAEIQLLPVLPDKPVVVKPEHPFYLTRDVKTRIYVRVPVWVRVMLGKTEIVEIPTQVLSKTWFGSFVDGELCYWISSRARKQIAADPSKPYLAICPIEIVNRSEDKLLVDKLCHRVRKLALYSQEGQLWSAEANVRFQGPGEVSEIKFARRAPQEAPDSMSVSGARDSVRRGFTAKTFDTLRDLATLDFFNRQGDS